MLTTIFTLKGRLVDQWDEGQIFLCRAEDTGPGRLRRVGDLRQVLKLDLGNFVPRVDAEFEALKRRRILAGDPVHPAIVVVRNTLFAAAALAHFQKIY